MSYYKSFDCPRCSYHFRVNSFVMIGDVVECPNCKKPAVFTPIWLPANPDGGEDE